MTRKVSIATGGVCAHSVGDGYPWLVYAVGNPNEPRGTPEGIRFKVMHMHGTPALQPQCEFPTYAKAREHLKRLRRVYNLHRQRGAIQWAAFYEVQREEFRPCV